MKNKAIRLIIRAMKLSLYVFAVQLAVLNLLIAEESTGQNTRSVRETFISLNLSGASITDAFKKLESVSDFKFNYDKRDIRTNKKIDLSFSNASFADILLSISKEYQLGFKQLNNTIQVDKLDREQADYEVEVVMAEVEITGKVTDENGEGLPGASIVVKGTSKGITSDIEGNYKLVVPDDAILAISFVGYETQEIAVGNQSVIDVQLVLDAGQLEEVVVIGYGTVKKSDLTGSVSSIKTKELTATPTVRLDDALRGKVAGMQITPTSSQPGAQSAIRIRGTNSLSGNSSPLFVIDGLIGSGNSVDLNVLDIESVEVLKDASATALYGSRGSAGVILITTKRGAAGQSKITYDTYTTFQSPTRLLPMLNAAEFGDWQNEVQGVDAYPNPASLGEGTDWQREIYQNNAPMVSHTLSASGGSEKSRFFVSANYFDQDGIFRGGNLKRYQFRFNGDHKINNILKVGNSVTLARTKTVPRASDIINIAGYFPTLPVKDDNGEYTIQTASSELNAENPVGDAAKNINLDTRSRMQGTLFAEIEPIKNLKYKLNFGSDLLLSKSENYAPSTLFGQTNDQGTASISNSEELSVLIEQTLSYSKEFGDHSIDGLLGFTRQRIFRSGSSVEAKGFTTDFFEYNNINAGSIRSGAGSNASEFGLQSYLFRANYGYKDKYLLTVNARIDGSSNFAQTQKYGTFPSLALAWRAGEEDFISQWGIFDDLKVRASYGRLGNPASGGSSLARLGAGFTYLFGPGQDITNGIGLNRLGNQFLKFETTDQLDIGLDAAFFDHRLQVTLDYYRKQTNDLFANENILWLAGVSNASIATNFGSMLNSGLELLINSVNVDRNGFKWETSFNISSNKNKLLEIPDENGEREINTFGGVISAPSALLREGEPVGVFYGLIRNGLWNTQQEIDDAGLTGFGVFPGGRRYEDISGPEGVPDGEITLDDRTIIGDPNPDFFGGIGNSLSYKGFEFSMYWSFVLGNDIFNETDSRINTAFDNNVSKRFANRWTPDNTSSDIPSVRGSFRSEILSESGIVENGSFLRMRNISIGYNLPVQNLTWVQAAKLYISGTNLILIDSYSGYDPEINRGNSNTRRGYDRSQDPALKAWTVGLRIDF